MGPKICSGEVLQDLAPMRARKHPQNNIWKPLYCVVFVPECQGGPVVIWAERIICIVDFRTRENMYIALCSLISRKHEKAAWVVYSGICGLSEGVYPSGIYIYFRGRGSMYWACGW
eukprot:1212777-Amorphochlora_amoeboformis.AAC.1